MPKNYLSNDMNALEIKDCLDSMMILVDTREQPSARASKRYASFGCPYRRQKLEYGDYTYNFRLPDGKWLYEADTSVDGIVCIERKMNLEELSGCFCQQRDRFKREFERAMDSCATIYLLVEDASWEKIINHRYRTKFEPKAFLASLTAWSARYGLKIIFIQHELSGRIIKEILYRELKERLEIGYYG